MPNTRAAIAAATARTKMKGTQPSATADAPVMNEATAMPRGGRFFGACAMSWLIGASTYR